MKISSNLIGHENFGAFVFKFIFLSRRYSPENMRVWEHTDIVYKKMINFFSINSKIIFNKENHGKISNIIKSKINK